MIEVKARSKSPLPSKSRYTFSVMASNIINNNNNNANPDYRWQSP